MTKTYEDAGVNIALGEHVAGLIGKHALTTMRPEVLRGIGFFGGMYEFKGYDNPVLVSSTDSVGTKLKLAIALNKHDTIGKDIVNHCVNDILTCGAEPLFFLDYIGIGKLEADKVESIAKGLAEACREAGCALIGGETAELPGMYAGEDYDLVGFVIGVVEKDRIINGSSITTGDCIIGLPSSGLHTNGYSLARKVLGETKPVLDKYQLELNKTLGEALLEPHRCYLTRIKPVLPQVKGLAHITGGGLIGNVPRVLPEGLTAHFDSKKWEVPPIFQLIKERGNIEQTEMYRVFNMGIGMVIICSQKDKEAILESIPDAGIIGEITPQFNDQRVIID